MSRRLAPCHLTAHRPALKIPLASVASDHLEEAIHEDIPIALNEEPSHGRQVVLDTSLWMFEVF